MDPSHPSISPEESRKFPVTTLLVAVVILMAAAAILVFNVPVTTILYFGFLGFMLFGHFFIHGGHGVHNGHEQGTPPSKQSGEQSNPDPEASQISQHSHVDGPARQDNPDNKSKKDQDSHQGHSGCC